MHVAYEDQMKINMFARNNAMLQDVKQELEDKKVWEFSRSCLESFSFRSFLRSFIKALTINNKGLKNNFFIFILDLNSNSLSTFYSPSKWYYKFNWLNICPTFIKEGKSEFRWCRIWYHDVGWRRRGNLVNYYFLYFIF